MPRSPSLAVKLADPGGVLSPASYDPAAANLCPGLNSVPSRHSAKRMPASFRASATAAVALPRLAAILVAHSCSPCVFGVFHRRSAHAASTSKAQDRKYREVGVRRYHKCGRLPGGRVK